MHRDQSADLVRARRALRRLGFSPIEAEQLVELKSRHLAGRLTEWPDGQPPVPPVSPEAGNQV